jgi:hypothetical protein
MSKELEQDILILHNALYEIQHICSYGWTDVKKECSKIYEIAEKVLKET